MQKAIPTCRLKDTTSSGRVSSCMKKKDFFTSCFELLLPSRSTRIYPYWSHMSVHYIRQQLWLNTIKTRPVWCVSGSSNLIMSRESDETAGPFMVWFGTPSGSSMTPAEATVTPSLPLAESTVATPTPCRRRLFDESGATPVQPGAVKKRRLTGKQPCPPDYDLQKAMSIKIW